MVIPPTMIRLFIRYLPNGAKFQAAAKFSGCHSLGHQVGGLAATSGADLNAVRTIQMIGTSVKNDIAIRVA
jgi:hypothetical protein